VELITAVTLLVFYNIYGLTFIFFFYLLLVLGLIVATFVDIPHRIIPNEISVGGVVTGFILCALRGINVNPLRYDFNYPLNSFLGIIIGGGIIYLTGKGFDLVYFKLLKNPPIQGETESMGGGDVKLLAMIGAFLGWQKAVLTFFMAPFFGLVIALINLIVKKDHLIPYGPFLSLAAIVSLLWGDRLIRLFMPW
jgi:leader peptidase (prepilin peptidase)/N-methyltransferase